jgi:hypothetical protein
MGVSGQRHASAALSPRGKDPWYPLDRRLGGPQSRSGHRLEEKPFHLCRGSNLDHPVILPVARHYTDWATRLTCCQSSQHKYSTQVRSSPFQFTIHNIRSVGGDTICTVEKGRLNALEQRFSGFFHRRLDSRFTFLPASTGITFLPEFTKIKLL